MNKISVIGAGAFGFAMANYVSNKVGSVSIFDVDKNLIECLKKNKRHKYHFTQVPLSDNITPTSNIKKCVENSDLVILCVPSCVVRKCLKNIKGIFKILNLSKGLEPETSKRVSEIISEELPNCKYGVLSGGMLAEDVIECKKLSATIASEDKEFLDELYNIFQSDTLDVVKSNDVVGVELCGPLKNIIAILIGILQGLNKGKEVVDKVLKEFSEEAKKLAVLLGGDEDTFTDESPAWYGDLMVSCFGNSRNRAFGIELGKGSDVNSVIEKMKSENKLVEGYSNSKIFRDIVINKNFDCKFFCAIYEILYENKDVKEFVNEL